jgi:aspartyl aminopeptidase
LPQTNLAPILATAAKAQLGLEKTEAPAAAAEGSGSGSGPAASKEVLKHHAVLLDLIAEQLGVTAADIVDFELNVRAGGGVEKGMWGRWG